MPLFRPSTCLYRIWEMDLPLYKQQGKKALFMDLDNTLCLWNGMQVEKETLSFLAKAKEEGFYLCIVSNNHARRIAPVAEKLGIPYLEKAKKPLPFRLKKAARDAGFAPCACVFVGDQLMTDMPAGNLCRMHTVLTVPIDTTHEYWWTAVNRKMEKILLPFYRISLPGQAKEK